MVEATRSDFDREVASDTAWDTQDIAAASDVDIAEVVLETASDTALVLAALAEHIGTLAVLPTDVAGEELLHRAVLSPLDSWDPMAAVPEMP